LRVGGDTFRARRLSVEDLERVRHYVLAARIAESL
jgi:hypothetical protein